MALISVTNKYFYSIGIFLVLVAIVYGGNHLKTNYLEKTDEYEMIQKYLLNESPLYGFNKPKLWIHTKYEINARKWKSFQSRNTTDLNQPFIHLTIKTIVNHCSNDFNICLIDDETFSKLIPSWDIDLSKIAEPIRSRLRTLGLLKLVYYYGGVVVPNSFICLKNLKPLYDEGIIDNGAFFCENINRSSNLLEDKHRRKFLPNPYFFGAYKNNECIKEFIEYIKCEKRGTHFTCEPEFLGDSSMFLLSLKNRIKIIDGQYVGVKDIHKKPILLDDLMTDGYIDIIPDCYGIYIPDDELLNRNNYSWFAVLPKDELLKTNNILVKYIISSLIEPNGIPIKTKKYTTAISI